MNYEEKMKEEMEMFKNHVDMTADLLVDSYKWHKLSKCAKEPANIEKYQRISDMLYEAYNNEHSLVMQTYQNV